MSTLGTSVLILDGGLGTTLEDVFHKDISNPLWSARPVEDEPEVIIAAHLAFLRAGADIILTSTYQCAYNTFERAGYSRKDAQRIMLKSVRLAMEAKRRYVQEQTQQSTHAGVNDPTPSREIKIALSLGPYGATLYPAHEFDGFYPPPFGPNLSHTTERTNAFADTDEGRIQERAAIDALTQFHKERLYVFADEKEVWDAIDFVAFETVPLRREILAIREAVTQLCKARGLAPADTAGLQGATQMKPWWISTVHPDGRYPEMKPGGARASTLDVAEAALLGVQEVKDGHSVPWAFGINCTSLEFLGGLLEEVQGAAIRASELYGRKPWLVLYPNRGDVYDPVTQTWAGKSGGGSSWAKELCTAVCRGQTEIWKGVILGGCCKTGPDEIGELRRELRN